MNSYSINIVHLYPDLLNLYGDKGNIECMKKRLMWRGIDVKVTKCTDGDDKIDFENADIIFLGGGSDREEEIVRCKLLEYKNKFLNYVENGGVLLAVCGGYPMLGKSYKLKDKETEGLGILDITTTLNDDKKRFIGNVIVKSPLTDNFIVGFENHGMKTDIGNLKPLGEVMSGNGNNGSDKGEGVVYKNVVGTYLHGPLLPKNPQLCDYILKNALKRKYSAFSELEKLDDSLENLANNYIVQEYNR